MRAESKNEFCKHRLNPVYCGPCRNERRKRENKPRLIVGATPQDVKSKMRNDDTPCGEILQSEATKEFYVWVKYA